MQIAIRAALTPHHVPVSHVDIASGEPQLTALYTLDRIPVVRALRQPLRDGRTTLRCRYTDDRGTCLRVVSIDERRHHGAGLHARLVDAIWFILMLAERLHER